MNKISQLYVKQVFAPSVKNKQERKKKLVKIYPQVFEPIDFSNQFLFPQVVNPLVPKGSPFDE